MTVEPPALFSTITEWPPSASLIFCPIARAWMSVCPPGANGTTMRIGLPAIGNCCACAAAASKAAHNAATILPMVGLLLCAILATDRANGGTLSRAARAGVVRHRRLRSADRARSPAVALARRVFRRARVAVRPRADRHAAPAPRDARRDRGGLSANARGRDRRRTG